MEKNVNGVKIEKRRKIVKGKVEKLPNEERTLFFFFFFCFSLFKPLKFVLGLPNGNFLLGKSISRWGKQNKTGKMTLPPQKNFLVRPLHTFQPCQTFVLCFHVHSHNWIKYSVVYLCKVLRLVSVVDTCTCTECLDKLLVMRAKNLLSLVRQHRPIWKCTVNIIIVSYKDWINGIATHQFTHMSGYIYQCICMCESQFITLYLKLMASSNHFHTVCIVAPTAAYYSLEVT